MTLQELIKEIVEIVEHRKKYRKEYGSCYCMERKYSASRLRRLRLLLNEILMKEEIN
jgi:hypothetical protein